MPEREKGNRKKFSVVAPVRMEETKKGQPPKIFREQRENK